MLNWRMQNGGRRISPAGLAATAPIDLDAFLRWGDGSRPRRPVELVGREGAIALGVELSMAAIFRGIPDALTAE
jgi:hypothetical protein